jgi:hypothetical protein
MLPHQLLAMVSFSSGTRSRWRSGLSPGGHAGHWARRSRGAARSAAPCDASREDRDRAGAARPGGSQPVPPAASARPRAQAWARVRCPPAPAERRGRDRARRPGAGHGGRTHRDPNRPGTCRPSGRGPSA